ncbi:hypothetical protein, partial [Vibrio parahaemolyticus]|uniref:hypothetical protein n=1 Tax=Vibrio parahaemolyticus TaxID=670 RepID=UPI0030D9A2E5
SHTSFEVTKAWIDSNSFDFAGLILIRFSSTILPYSLKQTNALLRGEQRNTVAAAYRLNH